MRRTQRRITRRPLLICAVAVNTFLAGCTGLSNHGDTGDGGGGEGNEQVTQLVSTRFPRLSHQQWENTVMDLFQLSEAPGLATDFDPDPPLGRFDTNTDRLVMSSGLWLDYQRAAEEMGARLTTGEGALEALLPAEFPEDAAEQARAYVNHFGTRAFRRPLTAAESARYEALFASASTHYDELDPLTAGVRLTIEAMLQSPNFLYRSELSEAGAGEPVQLTGYEVASRLSYSFWNTMPDAELMQAAAAGDLDTAGGVYAQAERMFDDERTRATFRTFHEQFYALAEYSDLEKNPARFPEWRREIGEMMQVEAEMFFESVVFDDGTIGDTLTSTTTFVNNELAGIYEVEGEFAESFDKVELDAGTRAGFLTRLGFLTRNATLSEPDPIHRGVFVNLDILCRPINAVPNLPDNLMPVGETNRERIESITGPGTCAASCHGGIINPIGFSLENYDAVGRYRTEDNGYPVDASSTYRFPDGRELYFDNAIDLSYLLADQPDPHACYLGNLLEYFHGSEIDRERFVLLGELIGQSLDDQAPIRELVMSMVASDSFRFRSATEQGVTQ